MFQVAHYPQMLGAVLVSDLSAPLEVAQYLLRSRWFVGMKIGNGGMMTDEWEKQIACAIQCSRCSKKLVHADQRLLSVYDHEPICLACKKEEEKRPDYEDVSKKVIGQCLADTELHYSDPGGYCFYHFYPFTCD